MDFRCTQRNLVERWTLQAAKNDLYWGKDVRLACKDGVDVHWSRVLLSTWSKVVAEDTELMVFPDFDSKLVVKALSWSARGKVRLERKELSDFYDVLLALGNYRQVQTNTITVDEDEQLVELDSEEEGKAKKKGKKKKRRRRAKKDYSSDSGMSSDDSSDEDGVEEVEEEENIVATSKKVMLGNVEAVYGVVPTKGTDTPRVDSPVAIAVNATPLQQLDHHQLGQHFVAGGYDPALLDGLVASDRLPVVKLPKLAQDEYEQQNEDNSSNANRSSSHVKRVFDCVLPGCSSRYDQYYHLKRHFVVSHYAQDLIGQFGTDGTCKICATTIYNEDTKMDHRKRKLVVHYGLVHEKVLDYASESVLKVFNDQNFATSSGSSVGRTSSIGRTSSMTSSIMPEKKKKRPSMEEPDYDYNPATNQRPCKRERTKPCLICPSMFQTNSNMLGHLSSSHFQDDLIGQFGDGPICIFCSSKIYDTKVDKGKKSWKLCYHYGVRHGRVLDVAPEEVKEQLKAMGVQVRDDIEPLKKVMRTALSVTE